MSWTRARNAGVFFYHTSTSLVTASDVLVPFFLFFHDFDADEQHASVTHSLLFVSHPLDKGKHQHKGFESIRRE